MPPSQNNRNRNRNRCSGWGIVPSGSRQTGRLAIPCLHVHTWIEIAAISHELPPAEKNVFNGDVAIPILQLCPFLSVVYMYNTPMYNRRIISVHHEVRTQDIVRIRWCAWGNPASAVCVEACFPTAARYCCVVCTKRVEARKANFLYELRWLVGSYVVHGKATAQGQDKCFFYKISTNSQPSRGLRRTCEKIAPRGTLLY